MQEFCIQDPKSWQCRTGNVLNPDFNESHTPDYQPIKAQKLVETIISRLAQRSKAQERISTVFNEPDFLPFRFLEVGIRRGEAVGQLTVKYDPKASEFIVKKLYETASQESGQSLTVADLEEMLKNLLDDEVNKKTSLTNVLKEVNEETSLANILKEVNEETPLHKFLESNDNRNKVSDLMAERRLPIATGFLVGYNHVLTAYHSLPSPSVVAEISGQKEVNLDSIQIVGDYQVEFGYEYDLMG